MLVGGLQVNFGIGMTIKTTHQMIAKNPRKTAVSNAALIRRYRPVVTAFPFGIA